MPEIKISIIVPVYNVADYIEQCIQSILGQTFQDFELILVDDCGSDDSIEKAEKMLLEGTIRYSVLRHDHNRGLSAARNTGMGVAIGKYVLFLDSDDMLTLDCLEKLYNHAEINRADVCYGAYETFGFGIESSTYNLDGNGFIMAWNKLCLRSFLSANRIKFIEGLIHEDNPWSFEIDLKRPQYAAVFEITYRYRIRENSLQTGKDYSKHYESYCKILKEYVKIIKENSVEASPQRNRSILALEQQKALFFSQTKLLGTKNQLRGLYHLIHNLEPISNPKDEIWKLADVHYLLPQCLGFCLYSHFYRYHLC